MVPEPLIARLPPPPRSMSLEVERDEERILPTARAGAGLLVHAAHSDSISGSQ
jgi:hypothetical protein